MSSDIALERLVQHDGIVHYPLGAGSYVFQSHFVDYMAKQSVKKSMRISIGAQPNSSPHFGTLVVFSLAFSLGYYLKQQGIDVEVFFEMVDTAPARKVVKGGIEYQVSLRESGTAQQYLEEYTTLMNQLKNISGVDYSYRGQQEFNGQEKIPSIVQTLIEQKEKIGALLDPDNGLLCMRAACPTCGLTDKEGIHNKFESSQSGWGMESRCPDHGAFTIQIETEASRLEYNTPLRNLIRALVYAEDTKDEHVPFEWLRVTGSDYAGYYQEQLLYKVASMVGYLAHELPPIIYAPLITDWSGAKLSKSLYVKQNAYQYMPQYLVNYQQFIQKFGEKGVEKLFNEVSGWVREPSKLFRSYSVYYFMDVFTNEFGNTHQS